MSLRSRIAQRPAANALVQTPAQPAVDNGPRLNATIWSLTALAGIFLGLRIFSKLRRKRSLWWDDYVLTASWGALAVSCSLLSACVSLGYGRRNSDILPENFDNVLLLSYAAGFASIVAALWSKISFALTLLRISTGRMKGFLWFIVITVNLVLGANATIHWVQCWPLDRLWHPQSHGKCWPRRTVIYYNIFAAAYSGAVDIVLALLPWVIIWASIISKREKLGTLIAMSMSIFAGITSFLKITTVKAIESDDTTDSVNLLIYGTAESASTVMAISIPMLRTLFHTSKQTPQFYRLQAENQVPFPSSMKSVEREDQGSDLQKSTGP